MRHTEKKKIPYKENDSLFKKRRRRIWKRSLPTFLGFASSITWVIAAGGLMGLNGTNSVPEGGCNFTFMDCEEKTSETKVKTMPASVERVLDSTFDNQPI